MVVIKKKRLVVTDSEMNSNSAKDHIKKDKCLKYFNHEHCYFALQNSPCCCIGFTDPLLQLAISVAAGLQELQIADTERAQYWSTAAAAEKLALGLSWLDMLIVVYSC